MLNLTNNINNLNPNSNISSIQKIQTILKFIDKKSTKKLITIYSLFSQIQQAINQQKLFCVYYNNKYLVTVLNILKANYVIFSYYKIPVIYFRFLLLFGFKPFFFKRLYYIYFSTLVYRIKLKLKIISKPSRLIFITRKKLFLLVNKKSDSFIYLLNTNKGLINSTQALQFGIGGELLCYFYYINK